MSYQPERAYLTHYSQVRNLERLAEELHSDIDVFVDLATKHKDAPDRTAVMQDAMFEHFVARLTDHGYTGDRDTMWSILNIDVPLNVQGLEYWLDNF